MPAYRVRARRRVLGASRHAARARETAILGRDDWREQLADSVPRTLLAFQLVGDEIARHNAPYRPLLTVVPAILAPLGLAICVARWRAPSFGLVPVWFAITLIPGMLTLEAPHASRLLDTIVPVALMVGIAADLVLAVVAAALPGRAGLATAAALGLVAGGVAAVQEYRAYFVDRPRLPQFYDAYAPWESAPARYLAARAPRATVYLDPVTYHSAATQFVARRYLGAHPDDLRVLRLQHDFPPREPLAGDALYLLPRPYTPVGSVVRAMWRDADCEDVRDAFGRLTMTACRVPHGAMRATQDAVRVSPYGLQGRFYGSDDERGEPVAEAPLAFPYIEYPLDEPPLGRFRRAEWDGTIEIERPGEYLFRLHPDSTTLTIDGRRVIDHAGARAFGGGSDGRVTLAAGRWPIHITLEPGEAGRYFLWFIWQPPGGEMEIVPPTALRPRPGR